jgi:purine-binding chemotaxis protein CheW
MMVDGSQHLVSFRLDGDEFAADVHAVERILRYAQPTAIPSLPDWLDGVLEYEARVIPIIDLRRRFGLNRTEPSAQTRIIVITVGQEWVGAVVDAVHDVVSVAADSVAPPPTLFRGLPAAYVRGLVRREGRLIVYLDVEQILSAHERLELQRLTVDAADA